MVCRWHAGCSRTRLVTLVSAAQRPPDEVVVVPPRQLRNRLLAHGTAAALLSPEEVERSAVPEVRRHLHAEALLEVDFPGGVIGVRFTLNFTCRRIAVLAGSHEMDSVGFSHWSLRPRREKVQLTSVVGDQILLRTHRDGLPGCRRLAQRQRACWIA